MASASGTPAQRKRTWSTRSPAPEFATATLERRFQKVRKLGRKIEGHSFAELHRLRIAIKKLRYAADFFSGLFPDNHARRMLRQLSSLQDILGEICDAAVALRLGSACAAALDDQARVRVQDVLSAWSRDREQALRGELAVAWKKYRATPAFWSKV
jgi:CHAD domain-containing protein